MLTAKSTHNHNTQTTEFSHSTLSKAPPPNAAQIYTFIHVADVHFLNFRQDARQPKLRGLVTLKPLSHHKTEE